jgi:pimeloyl-ACP methyl ester carboxylesterase
MHPMLVTVLALALGAGLLIAGCASSTTNPTADRADTTMAASAPRANFAGLVDIGGGRKMYMKCRGKGSPTVVLVSGLGNAADIWSVTADPKNERPVFSEVARFTRVCAYDRPATTRTDDTLSPSTPVEQPTSAKPAAADLDALLRASGEPAPYVLVGHSFGGPIIRLYAGAHPAEVGGLVLVDALSEDLPNGLSPEQEALFEKINTPPPGSHTESLDESSTFKQLRESPPAPPVPVIVLTADRPQLTKEALATGQFPAGVDQEFADALWAAQLAAQDKLAEKFPSAEHITDTNSTHYIQLENPQLVIASVREVVEAAGKKQSCALGFKNHGQCVKALRHAGGDR